MPAQVILMTQIKRPRRAFGVSDIAEAFDAGCSAIHREADGVYLHLETGRFGDATARAAAIGKRSAALRRLDACQLPERA